MVMKDKAERGRMGDIFLPSKNINLPSKDLKLPSRKEVLVMYDSDGNGDGGKIIFKKEPT